MTVRQHGDAPVLGAATVARWAPLAALGIGLVALYAFGLQHYLSLDALRRYQVSLSGLVTDHALAAIAVYVVVYVAAVAISFPGASFFTIAGGFMFGWASGMALAVLSATAGATLIFLIARTSMGETLTRRAGPRLSKLRQGFQENSFSYLLFLRLAPVFPFFLVNLAAALFGIRLASYLAATAIGILPGTFILAYFGDGLRTALDRTGSPFSIELLVGLFLLAGLALVPVVLRQRRGGKDAKRQVPG